MNNNVIKKMNKLLSFAIFMFVSVFMVSAAGFSSPIVVEDVSVDEVNGENIVLVLLQNNNTSSGVFTELSFTIEELGTSKNLGVFRVDSNDTQAFSFELEEVTDSFDLLKKGETFTLTASTDDDSQSTSFLFGPFKDTEGLDLVIEEIELNGVEVTDTDSYQVLNGELMRVDVQFTALENFDDARLMVFVEGYEHAPIVETTEIFKVVEDKMYTKSFLVNLPSDMDSEKDYTLRITGANDLSGLTVKELDLYVDTERHRVDIVDFIATPNSGVEPGQNMIANVRMKNRGQKSQDSTKVIVSIPELGVEEASYISNLNKDEVATSDDMLLYIPEEAEAKTYEVLVTLAYDDGYTSSSESFSLNVLAPRVTPEESLMLSFDNNIDFSASEATTFDVVVANPNSESKPVSLAVVDNSWAEVDVSPSLSMIEGGKDATFKVTVTPKEAIEGERELAIMVKEGAQTVSTFDVQTYVAPSEAGVSWTNIVLAVLLIVAIIILLALVIAIARRRSDDDGDDEELESSTEEYY